MGCQSSNRTLRIQKVGCLTLSNSARLCVCLVSFLMTFATGGTEEPGWGWGECEGLGGSGASGRMGCHASLWHTSWVKGLVCSPRSSRDSQESHYPLGHVIPWISNEFFVLPLRPGLRLWLVTGLPVGRERPLPRAPGSADLRGCRQPLHPRV